MGSRGQRRLERPIIEPSSTSAEECKGTSSGTWETSRTATSERHTVSRLDEPQRRRRLHDPALLEVPRVRLIDPMYRPRAQHEPPHVGSVLACPRRKDIGAAK